MVYGGINEPLSQNQKSTAACHRPASEPLLGNFDRRATDGAASARESRIAPTSLTPASLNDYDVAPTAPKTPEAAPIADF
jgi:hypothetical protein